MKPTGSKLVAPPQKQPNQRNTLPAPAVQATPTAAPQPSTALPTPLDPTPTQILALQRRVGNHAVNQLLARHKVQAKLTVGPANDHYEQEADRVAAQVMAPSTPAPSPLAQRVEEDETLQTKPLAASITRLVQRASPEEEELQAAFVQRTSAEAGFEVGADFETHLNTARTGGAPLPISTRTFMEQQMGADFSGVKVHTDARADQLSQAIQAKAFTTGADVFFRAGAYEPSSQAGQTLLAHELTHVVQQGNAGTVIQNKAVENSPPQPNTTGMPDTLKTGLEQLSGLDLSGVRVNYNSPKPAAVQAYAYTQGQEIEVAPGQEEHLPHEGWHVVQQLQGRVKPTLQAKSMGVNLDDALETEADVMGAQAAALSAVTARLPTPAQAATSGQRLGQPQTATPPTGTPVRQYACGGKKKTKAPKTVQSLDLGSDHHDHDHESESLDGPVETLEGTFPIDFVVVSENPDALPGDLNPTTLVRKANQVLAEGSSAKFDIALEVGHIEVIDDFFDIDNDPMFKKIPEMYRAGAKRDGLVIRNYVMKQSAEKALQIAAQRKDDAKKASVVFVWDMAAKEGDDVSGFTVRGVGDREGDIATSNAQGLVIEQEIKANLNQAGYGGMVHLFGTSPSASMDKLGETLAHEFGHVLDLKHEHGKENLMHATVGERGHGITNKQVNTMNQQIGIMEDTLGGKVKH